MLVVFVCFFCVCVLVHPSVFYRVCLVGSRAWSVVCSRIRVVGHGDSFVLSGFADRGRRAAPVARASGSGALIKVGSALCAYLHAFTHPVAADDRCCHPASMARPCALPPSRSSPAPGAGTGTAPSSRTTAAPTPCSVPRSSATPGCHRHRHRHRHRYRPWTRPRRGCPGAPPQRPQRSQRP